MKRLQEQLLALAPRWGVGRGVGGEGAGCGPPSLIIAAGTAARGPGL